MAPVFQKCCKLEKYYTNCQNFYSPCITVDSQMRAGKWNFTPLTGLWKYPADLSDLVPFHSGQIRKSIYLSWETSLKEVDKIMYFIYDNNELLPCCGESSECGSRSLGISWLLKKLADLDRILMTNCKL